MRTKGRLKLLIGLKMNEMRRNNDAMEIAAGIIQTFKQLLKVITV
jgi:hypothetical protein